MAKIKLKKARKVKSKRAGLKANKSGFNKLKSNRSTLKRIVVTNSGLLKITGKGRNHNIIRKSATQVSRLHRVRIASAAVVKVFSKYLSFGAFKIRNSIKK